MCTNRSPSHPMMPPRITITSPPVSHPSITSLYLGTEIQSSTHSSYSRAHAYERTTTRTSRSQSRRSARHAPQQTQGSAGPPRQPQQQALEPPRRQTPGRQLDIPPYVRSGVTNAALSHYLRCRFTGRQDRVEEKLETFITEYLDGKYYDEAEASRWFRNNLT